MKAFSASAVTALVLALGSASCGDNTEPTQRLVVTGTIQNNTGAPIPAGTRLVVAWTVTSGTPDYSYLFGEGTLDPATNTFRVELDQPPPAPALNDGALGVGIIVAITNQTSGTGDDVGQLPPPELVGAAGRYGIIFRAAGGAQIPEWAELFENGYGVGIGVDVPDGFDQFQPTSSSSVVLIIDDLENIDFVNWT